MRMLSRRRVWLLAASASALLLLLKCLRLVSPSAVEKAVEEAAACALAERLTHESSPLAGVRAATDEVVRIFWWHRFQGQRRSSAAREVHECAGSSTPMRCVSDSRPLAFSTADAVVIWSGPDHRRGACLPPQLASHTWVLEYSEPPEVDARTASELYDAAFTQRFQVKVSHELDSDVVLTALHPLVEGGAIPPSLWLRSAGGMGPRVRGIAWLASPKASGGCATPNRRDELVRRLERALPRSLPLYAIGRCLHNRDEPRLVAKQADGGGNASTWGSKVRALGRYAFCLVAENSIAADYVTEKIFHAFAAGCLPVYYGTEDVARFLPTPAAALQVLDYPSLDALASHLAALAGNATAYGAHVAWRDDATLVRAWWGRMQAMTDASETATKPALFCAICRAVRRRRAEQPQHRLRASPRPRHAVWPPLFGWSSR